MRTCTLVTSAPSSSSCAKKRSPARELGGGSANLRVEARCWPQSGCTRVVASEGRGARGDLGGRRDERRLERVGERKGCPSARLNAMMLQLREGGSFIGGALQDLGAIGARRALAAAAQAATSTSRGCTMPSPSSRRHTAVGKQLWGRWSRRFAAMRPAAVTSGLGATSCPM